MMTKGKKHSLYCMVCDWKLENTHKFTDGLNCQKCNSPVIRVDPPEGGENT